GALDHVAGSVEESAGEARTSAQGRGRRAELKHVGGIRGERARSDMGDLPLMARAGNGGAVGAIGIRANTQRATGIRLGKPVRAQSEAVLAFCYGGAANRGAVVAGGCRQSADRGGEVAAGFGGE